MNRSHDCPHKLVIAMTINQQADLADVDRLNGDGCFYGKTPPLNSLEGNNRRFYIRGDKQRNRCEYFSSAIVARDMRWDKPKGGCDCAIDANMKAATG
ncbi:hypothetical protein A1332_21540 [Methylomonas methanica]|uniref:Uncharacterized protein n=1 Tax=Methylomonas methanica TaxID=421 RepID=A0A177LWE7_METMH|nr:hypothetical protein A1332_21540 [Methylomonas methanica]